MGLGLKITQGVQEPGGGYMGLGRQMAMLQNTKVLYDCKDKEPFLTSVIKLGIPHNDSYVLPY